MTSFEVFVSSDNSPYLAWQTQVFCYSAVSHLAIKPTVLVHKGDELLRDEYALLRLNGFRILEVPIFSGHPVGRYLSRNEVGSLLAISELPRLECDSILFCEPDMIFIQPMRISQVLAAERYAYLDYGHDRITAVLATYGLAGSVDILNSYYQIGVPYHIPTALIRRLARRWLEVIDRFEKIEWIDIMYAFGIATLVEKLEVKATSIMSTNMSSSNKATGELIHYCYGDDCWSKRTWYSTSPLHSPAISSLAVPSDGTVFAHIITQIRGAHNHFYAKE